MQPRSHSSGCATADRRTAGVSAIHLASRDSYEDAALPSGYPVGTPEEALDCAAGVRVSRGFRSVLSDGLVERFERRRPERLGSVEQARSRSECTEAAAAWLPLGLLPESHGGFFFLGWVQVTALWWTRGDAT